MRVYLIDHVLPSLTATESTPSRVDERQRAQRVERQLDRYYGDG